MVSGGAPGSSWKREKDVESPFGSHAVASVSHSGLPKKACVVEGTSHLPSLLPHDSSHWGEIQTKQCQKLQKPQEAGWPCGPTGKLPWVLASSIRGTSRALQQSVSPFCGKVCYRIFPQRDVISNPAMNYPWLWTMTPQKPEPAQGSDVNKISINCYSDFSGENMLLTIFWWSHIQRTTPWAAHGLSLPRAVYSHQIHRLFKCCMSFIIVT